MNRQKIILSGLVGVIVLGILASAIFSSRAQKTSKWLDSLPPELDVRVKGGVLSGKMPEGKAAQVDVTAGDQSLRANVAQAKSLRALESAVHSQLKVEYNRLTGTPRHMFASGGYLSEPSTAMPETIARNFIQHW